jgi:hypothetical protein
MKIIFSGVFWGLVLVFIGCGWVLNNTLGLNIHVFGIVFSLIIIYLGIMLLVGANRDCCRTENIAFDERSVKLDSKHGKYSVTFGSGNFTLDNSVKPPASIEISVVFGGAKLYINKDTPVKVIANAAFGGIEMPSGRDVAFGRGEYSNPAFGPDKDHVIVKVDVAFGGCEIFDN